MIIQTYNAKMMFVGDDAILQRRSVRKYTEEPIPDEKFEKILQAGLMAPTSQNRKKAA